MRKSNYVLLFPLALALLASGCDSDSAVAPQYEPEVVNTANVAFSFQSTGLEDVNDVVSYTWNVSSGNIVIHPSTATTAGTITLTILDADNVVIYQGDVPPSGDITPPSGAPCANNHETPGPLEFSVGGTEVFHDDESIDEQHVREHGGSAEGEAAGLFSSVQASDPFRA